MRTKIALVLASLLVPASGALAQPTAEPALLKLPMGARVRVRTLAAPGYWMKGVLVSADSASVALVPENAPPLGANQLVVPSASVTRFELATGKKRQWLYGLVIGAAVGVALGFTDDVDPVVCEFNENVLCSRKDALLTYGFGSAATGVLIGAFVKKDRWTPVVLDALAPPPPRVSGLSPHLRALPGGGVELGLSVGF